MLKHKPECLLIDLIDQRVSAKPSEAYGDDAMEGGVPVGDQVASFVRSIQKMVNPQVLAWGTANSPKRTNSDSSPVKIQLEIKLLQIRRPVPRSVGKAKEKKKAKEKRNEQENESNPK